MNVKDGSSRYLTVNEGSGLLWRIKAFQFVVFMLHWNIMSGWQFYMEDTSEDSVWSLPTQSIQIPSSGIGLGQEMELL